MTSYPIPLTGGETKVRVIPSIELRVDGEVKGVDRRVVQLGFKVDTVAIIELDECLPCPMAYYADVPIDVVQLHTRKK